MSGTRPSFAAAYAALGWPTFPLYAPGSGPSGCDCQKACGKDAAKHPRTIHGLSDASTDPDVIARWWRMWRDANIGIATGARAGILVLDVDPKNGGDASLSELLGRHGPFPATPCVHTGGGGLHYYFAHPGGVVPNSAGRIAPGIDIRGDGGYVVAPPSQHISGQTYTWAEACPATPPPMWLSGKIRNRGPEPQRPRIHVETVLAGLPAGERDDGIFRLACKLRRADVPRDVAEDLVLRAARACSPPFPEKDALRKVESAYGRYRPATPAGAAISRSRLVNLR